MNIIIICIGNELLSGKTINTNASWLGKTLTSIGCNVNRQIVIPDENTNIKTTLDDFIKNNPDEACLIVTGGLGPTADDVTRKSLFDFFDVEEKFDSEYWEELSSRFKKSGLDIPITNQNQALIPSKGEIIKNPLGSARGFKFKSGKATIFSLPGVPSEMKAMTLASIVPWLRHRVKDNNYELTVRTTGIPESVLVEEIFNPLDKARGCKVGFYPSLFGVDIHLSSKYEEQINNLGKNISKILGHKIFGYGADSMEQVVVKMALEKKISISFAESCTGGLLGHRITEVPGSSDIFKGGVVVYSNDAKINILGVDRRIIDEHGAVSQMTAKIMAERVKEFFSSDYGISVTGIAGPDGGTDDKPVGLVYVAFANDNKTSVKKFNFNYDRANNKLKTSQEVLNLIRLEIMNV